jgi:hypothetical protein
LILPWTIILQPITLLTDDYPADDHYPVADALSVTDAYPTDPESGETKESHSRQRRKSK